MNPLIVVLLAATLNTLVFGIALIIVFSGFPDSYLITRLCVVTLMFSLYVPGLTIITSPEAALFTAFCIESVELTEISLAAAIPETNAKISMTISRMINFLIFIPQYKCQSLMKFFNKLKNRHNQYKYIDSVNNIHK